MISLSRTPCDESILRAVFAGPGCAARAKPFVLAASILGSSMAFIDGSVVNVALPAMQRDLAASVAGAQWIVNAYLLALGALVLVGGAAGDRFGRRRIFAAGVALFGAASIACGAAASTSVLVASRALQGVGGALLVPSSLAILSAAFPRAERSRAIGSWAGFSALTAALGPVIGGWLVDALTWRAMFFINVPIALATLALTAWHVPESRDDASEGVDWLGGFLAVLGLAGWAYGLTEASDGGWAQLRVGAALVAGTLVLAIFLWREARARAPLVPLGLFASARFAGANLITLLLYFALSGALFFLPFELIRLQHYSAAETGAAFLPFTLIMGGLSRWTGGLAERYGARLPLLFGPIVAGIGFALLAVPGRTSSYWTGFFPAMIVLGIGMAISVTPLTSTVMGAVEERHAGAASGINNAVARIAGMLAVAVLGAVAVVLFRAGLASRLADAPPELRQAMLAETSKLAAAAIPANIADASRAGLERAMDESLLHSFRVMMLVAAGLALIGALCAGATINRQRGRARPD